MVRQPTTWGRSRGFGFSFGYLSGCPCFIYSLWLKQSSTLSQIAFQTDAWVIGKGIMQWQESLQDKFDLYENDGDDYVNISFLKIKKKTDCGDMHYKSHKLRSLYPLLHSLLVIVIYCITACCWIPCPCIHSPCWKTDPRWTNAHYSLQCLRTWVTTCDTYKWLACTVCLRQSRCRGWPDGLWSTLLCNTHAACPSPKGGPGLQFTYIYKVKEMQHHTDVWN